MRSFVLPLTRLKNAGRAFAVIQIAATTGILLPVHGQPALTEALESDDLQWSTNPYFPWVGQTNVTHDGVDGAQSSPVFQANDSWMETMVAGPGTVSFWWRVSCNPT